MSDAEDYNNGINPRHSNNNMIAHIILLLAILAIPLALLTCCLRTTANVDTVVDRSDEQRFRRVAADADNDDANEDYDGDELDDELVRPCRGIVTDSDDSASGPGGGGTTMSVRASKRSRFVRKMSWWLKSEFPGAIRRRTTADDEVMRVALSRHLRSLNVRYRDIALLTPRIMTLAYMPTQADIVEARLWATEAAGERMHAHVGWVHRVSGWFGSRGYDPGFRLAAK